MLRINDDDSDEWVTPGDISEFSGYDERVIGMHAKRLGLTNKRNYGYRQEDLLRVLEREEQGL